MVYRPVRMRILAVILSLLTIIVTAPFSIAETVATSPLGTIATTGSVTVGNAAAPTGTTIFAGDKVVSNQPALISFGSGSRIEMTKAAATFTRQGQTLVVQADEGLLRFNFKKGESVQISAGKFQITGLNESNHIGELGLNRNGQIAMTVTEGNFAVLNTETGARTEVTPSKPLADAKQGGAASITGQGEAVTSSVNGVVTVMAVGAAAVLTVVGISQAKSDSSR